MTSRARSASKKLEECLFGPTIGVSEFKSEGQSENANRNEFRLPPSGWFQILKVGEWPHKESGTVQVVDELAVKGIVAKFNSDKAADPNFPGMLVDYDHFSRSQDSPSEAAAWIEELQAKDDGVWARARWTPTGRSKAEGGEYRLVSPVLSAFESVDENDATRQRPMAIVNVALTNDPNIRGMTPVSLPSLFNRGKGGSTGRSNNDAARRKTQEMNPREMLCKLLGLDPACSDEELTAAFDTKTADMRRKTANAADEKKVMEAECSRLKAENAGLKNRLVETAEREYAKEIGDDPETKKIWNRRLNENHEMATDFLRAIRSNAQASNRGSAGGKNEQSRRPDGGDPSKRIHNRDNGAHPDNPDGKSDDKANRMSRKIGAEAAKAVEMSGGKLTYALAFRSAVANAIAAGEIDGESDLVGVPAETEE